MLITANKFYSSSPRGSVLGLLLFAVYCSPGGDVITDHGVDYHQYADVTQLHLAMSVDNTAAGLCSCCMFRSHQTVVPTKQPAA